MPPARVDADHSPGGRMIPRVKDIYEVVALDGRVRHIRSGEEVVLEVAGRRRELLERLLPALDGRKDVAVLAAELADVADAGAVRAAVAFLVAEGIVADAAAATGDVPEALRGQAAYLSHSLPDPAAAIETLARTRCRVIGDGPSAEMLAEELKAHGLGGVEASVLAPAEAGAPQRDGARCLADLAEADADVAAVVTETFQPQLCREANRALLAAGRPALYVDLASGNHGVIGPMVVPAQTSCYACYEARLLAAGDNDRERLDYEAFLRTRPARRAFGHLPALDRMTVCLAAVELLSYLTGYRAARAIDGALIVDFHEPAITREPVLKLPACEACGPLRTPAGGGGRAP